MCTSTVRCLRSPRDRSYFLRSSAISSWAVPSLALSAASACCFSCSLSRHPHKNHYHHRHRRLSALPRHSTCTRKDDAQWRRCAEPRTSLASPSTACSDRGNGICGWGVGSTELPLELLAEVVALFLARLQAHRLSHHTPLTAGHACLAPTYHTAPRCHHLTRRLLRLREAAPQRGATRSSSQATRVG